MKHSISGKDLYSWRQWAAQLAQENDVDTIEIDWFLQGLTSLSSLSLRLEDYKEQENVSSKATVSALKEKWQQRINSRIPVQYLTGEMPWRNFLLTVTPDVLIPRPETELIIDIAKELVEQSPIKEYLLEGHWVDLGTGSGAIALALAHQFPQATVHAVDISKKANLQKQYQVVVVPTIVILQYDEELKRYQADLSFKLAATKEEVQDAIDELVLGGF